MERPTIQALDHVALEVISLPEAAAFYGTVLGLSPLVAPKAAIDRGICWFALPEGKMLHLVENPQATPARVGHLALRVDSVEEWRAYLKELRIADEPPTVALYGTVDRLFIRDPSGNRIELLRWSR